MENAKSEGRGLIHSNRGRDKESDYSIPRSKQCFILPDEDNERFFDTLEKWGVEDNTFLKGTLYEFLKGER
ncbi:MAG: hypothetical protein J6O88_16270 [Chryseobacterium sp.]|uniref:hypothetical protein n=1 Tax=Chryseobacterium sp. TaxID=1871047 RepID=UPI001B0BC4EB|nr:hypothetical protein [Chryseobacterium sp.]MBO6186215.1 hypothetical protein [Chryseobacterium sp.]